MPEYKKQLFSAYNKRAWVSKEKKVQFFSWNCMQEKVHSDCDHTQMKFYFSETKHFDNEVLRDESEVRTVMLTC